MKPFIETLTYMVERNISFSIYMAHGGTSFGLWSGADRPFSPDTSSYDYHAPISEAGQRTEKFEAARDLFAQYLLPGETVPETPKENPIGTLPTAQLTEFAHFWNSSLVVYQNNLSNVLRNMMWQRAVWSTAPPFPQDQNAPFG